MKLTYAVRLKRRRLFITSYKKKMLNLQQNLPKISLFIKDLEYL